VRASRRHLRSAASGDLQVLATRTITFGPQSYAASAPNFETVCHPHSETWQWHTNWQLAKKFTCFV